MPILGTFAFANAVDGHYSAICQSIAQDSSGNFYVSGVFATGSGTATVNFGGGSGEIPVVPGKYGYIVKYDTLGNYLESRLMLAGVAMSSVTISIDAFDNIFAAVNWGGQINFGDGVRNSHGFLYDSGLIKYTGITNAPIWTRQWYTASGSVYNIARFCVNNSNDVIMGWRLGSLSSNPVDFGDGNSYYGGIVLGKIYGGSGLTAWTKNFASSSPNGDFPYMTSVDASDNIYLSARTPGPIDFGIGPTGNGGFFIAKRTTDKARIWDVVVGSPTNFATQIAPCVLHAVEPISNTLFLFSNFSGSIDFGSGPITTPYGQNGGTFISRYNASTGAYIPQAQCWGTSLSSQAFAIGCTGGTCTFVTYVSDYVDWGDGTGIQYIPGGTAFVNMRPDGTISWVSMPTGAQFWSGSFWFNGLLIGLTGQTPTGVSLPPFSVGTSGGQIGFSTAFYQFRVPTPNPNDFVPIYAPSASPALIAKFGFTWNGTLPAGASNILIKYWFPAGTLQPWPGPLYTPPYLLLNYPDTSGYFGPRAYGFVYKVVGGDGGYVGPYQGIANWGWQAAFANASGNPISPYTSLKNVTKTTAVIVSNNYNPSSTGYANAKVTTVKTSRGNLQSVSI